MDTSIVAPVSDLQGIVRRIGGVPPELATRAEAAASIILAGKVAQHADCFEVLGSGEKA